MTLRERLAAYAEDHEITLIFFDPPEYFDAAIVGLVHGFSQDQVVLYDQMKVIAAMAADMGEEEAEEWFEFNTIGGWYGAATPRFLVRPEEVFDEPQT